MPSKTKIVERHPLPGIEFHVNRDHPDVGPYAVVTYRVASEGPGFLRELSNDQHAFYMKDAPDLEPVFRAMAHLVGIIEAAAVRHHEKGRGK